MSNHEESLLKNEDQIKESFVSDKTDLFRVTGDFDLKIEDIEILESKFKDMI